MFRRFTLVALLALALGPLHAPLNAQDPVEVEVDWTRQEGPFNRTLFSIQGFMQVYVEPDPMVMETFTLLNPKGTQTRLETWIHRMEPENDNDDPHEFNWDKLYPEKMIRFIDDREPFEKVVDELGMERLSLLCYNVDWLRSDDPEWPIKDNEEWAEFAAAVVETYNGAPGSEDYHPNLRLVQIWNEPNLGMFWDGNDEAFFELYNTAADRIKANYPGVLIGGPTITPAGGDIVEYMERFLEACGHNTDFVIFHHYGPMGQGVDPITDHIEIFRDMFRALPGKEDGKVMITETDAWFIGWEKMDFMFERQFRLMDIADVIKGIHHFCAMHYDESGNYAFGMVDEKGGILEGTWWPYWLFRNTIGNLSPIKATEGAELDFVATTHRNDHGAFLGSTVLRNKTESPKDIVTTLNFEPADAERILTRERIAEDFRGVAEVITIPAGADSHTMPIRLTALETVALTLRTPGERHFAFRDLNNQEHPWIGIEAKRGTIELGETIQLDVSVTNTLNRPVSGTLRIEGIPSGWSHGLVEGTREITGLATGETARMVYQMQADNVPSEEWVGVYAVLDEGTGATELALLAHSIAASWQFDSPLDLQIVPQPIYAVAGEENSVTLQIHNSVDFPIEGNLSIRLPEGLSTIGERAMAFTQDAQSRSRYRFAVNVDDSIETGHLEGTLIVEFLGASAEVPIKFQIVDDPGLGNQRPVDLTNYLNFDPVSFADNRRDYDHEMGMFIFPADHTPSAAELRSRGRLFQLADLDGDKTVVRPAGQRISVEAGSYSGLSMLGFAHDGRHRGTWTLHYADGSSEAVDSMIPEWCTPPPEGYQVAFYAPYRYVAEGNAMPACELFMWQLPVDAGRNLVAVEFPEIVNGYVFAMTLVEPGD